MAVTAIWKVEDNLNRVIDYTTNPEKTKNIDFNEYEFKGLENVLEYTADNFKTEKQLYVSALNCYVETAAQEMIITKKQFQKEKGILAFHAYQSFAPKEVNAEVAHQIGIELANAMWGDRFEVLVSTHLDKEHYHNHFVINSVSFADGLRYYDNKENYKKIRLLSDNLCRKYQLSVIENPKKKSMHYSQWQAEKQYKPSWRSVIREDVDYAISQSMTMKQFYTKLESMGYEIKFGKHIAIRPPQKDRFVRLRSLSNDNQYCEEAIKEKILEQSIVHLESIYKPEVIKTYHYKGSLNKAKKLTGLRALYFHYLYRMGILPKHAPKKRVHFLLKEDIRYIDKITQETTLLCKKKINTINDLEKYKEQAQCRLDNLLKERRCTYNKVRRCRNSDTKEKLQRDISTLSDEIKQLRKEVMLYEGIKHRSQTMKTKLEVVKENERKESEQNERKWRNSRSDCKDEFTRN